MYLQVRHLGTPVRRIDVRPATIWLEHEHGKKPRDLVGTCLFLSTQGHDACEEIAICIINASGGQAL